MHGKFSDKRRERAEAARTHAPAAELSPQPASRHATRLGVLGGHQGHRDRGTLTKQLKLLKTNACLAQETAGTGHFTAVLAVISEPATRLGIFA